LEIDMATKSNTAASTGAEITGDGSGVALPPFDPSTAQFAPSSGGPLPGEVLTPMAEPEGGWPADEFTGKGGNYVRDLFTGVRTPAVPAAE
jgi:hypothetical protein